jgi:RNA-binding protein NOB1
VVDANAIIGGASHLLGASDRFFTIRQVLEEVRDPISRLQMASVPLTLECVEPEKEAITKGMAFNCCSFFLSACVFFWAFFGAENKKQECQIVCFWCVAVVQFARATGDLQALSEVDLKLIALAYTLETQAHGTSHLRSKPPPLQVYFSLH